MTKPAISLGGAVIQALRIDSSSDQTVAIGAGSLASSAIPAKVSVVQIVASVDCHITLGNPNAVAATATSTLLPALTILFMKVFEGDIFSVIQDVGAGVLYITEAK